MIFLIGTGDLAKSIVNTISGSSFGDVEIIVFSREITKSRWLAAIGNSRAFLRGNRQKYLPKVVDWESEEVLIDDLEVYRPRIVINCSSLQSMWTLSQRNAWSRLVLEVGYGITLPLQSELSMRVSRAIQKTSNDSYFINCCYPDLVNLIITRNELDVFSGVGNISIISSLFGVAHSFNDYFILANHYHVQQCLLPPEKRSVMPILWLDNELSHRKDLFDCMRIADDSSVNSITSMTCLSLIETLWFGGPMRHHLSGPGGLPGGYPVTVKGGEIFHLGTEDMLLECQTSWNLSSLSLEGTHIERDSVHFSDHCNRILSKYSSVFAKGFKIVDVGTATEEMKRLKQRLIDLP